MGRAVLSPSPPPLAAAWLLCALALLAACASALTVEDFYPFGAANGDTTMKKCYSCASNILRLPSAVPVFGVPGVRGVYINSNGAVHFRRSYDYSYPNDFPFQDPTFSMVAGYWTDLYNNCANCGQITYRSVQDTATLAGISKDVHQAFPSEQLATSFSATTAIIATWNNTARCCSARVEAESFQIVIAFNTDTTFLFLLYANNRPQTTYVGYYYAQAGFNVGDGVRGYSLPGARTDAVGNATRDNSNIGQPGKWCFGLTANQTIGTVAYAGGPYTVDVCDSVQLRADGGLDACGQPRVLAWDLDNDGEFDDAAGEKTLFTPLRLQLREGVYVITARASSPSPCAASPDPLLLSATVTVTGTTATNLTLDVYTSTQSGYYEAFVGEQVTVYTSINGATCGPYNLTIDCGPGNVAKTRNRCQYNTTGEKHIIAKLEQNGYVFYGERLIAVKTLTLGGPYETQACGLATINAGARVDACGKARVFKWDFDGDGAFDDATGSRAYFRNNYLLNPPGVYTVSVQASSPTCPASPPELRTTTVNITATPPSIYRMSASTLSGKSNATIGENITILTTRIVQTCLPYSVTIDCGPDNVSNKAGVCRYNSTGVKVITARVEQFGFVATRSISVTIRGFFIEGPYRTNICSYIALRAAAGVDACGQRRTLAWDLDNDDLFDDASGNIVGFNAYDQGLSLGVHSISVRASSSSCPASPPEVVSTFVNVSTTRVSINSISTYPASGHAVASVGERIRVSVSSKEAYCVPDNLVIHCGADSVGNESYYCRYSTPGVKTITATIMQYGVTAKRSRNITVTSFYTGGPYRVAPCRDVRLAAPTTIDACGKQRFLAWDFDNDGAFDDATGSAPYLFTSQFRTFTPGVHPVSVQSSSRPACPASPTEVHAVNVTVTAAAKPVIYSIITDPASNNPVASVEEDVSIYVSKSYVVCLPYTLTIDCGADNVADNRTSYCRYATPGQKTITATLTQSGISVSRSRNITVAANYFGGPYRVRLCSITYLKAAGGLDECGYARNLTWDLNNDGNFDDATGSTPAFNAYNLQLLPGVYPISVRASGDVSSCPKSVPIVFATNVTVYGAITPPRIDSVRTQPESGNARASVGEAIRLTAGYAYVSCLPFNLTIDCGLDHVGNKTGYCQYGTGGVKLITITLSQAGVVATRKLNVTVTSTAPSCTTAAFPEGRVRGKRGCSPYRWTGLSCKYPNNIKPYTKLYDAFASRASEDARLIKHQYGNRTVAQALRTNFHLLDTLAKEATAALLNAETVYYAQCPLSVKLDFRHTLYNASNRTRVYATINKFYSQNLPSAGCNLYC